MTSFRFGKLFGGTLLVAGTCIGAGMLALPVSTAAGGFIASAIVFFFCWLFMLTSALFMLEVSLWYPESTNLITMARSTLGKGGEVIAWGTYVLFLYALMGAYTAGAAGIVGQALNKMMLDEKYAIWVVTCIFASIVYLGTRFVDWSNRLLMTGLVVAYALLVTTALPKVAMDKLFTGEAQYLWTVGPLLAISFGFHLLIPTLREYMNSDIRALRYAIVLGSLLSLIVYLFWEFIVLGTVPLKGEGGLAMLLYQEHTIGKQAVVALPQLLSNILHSARITVYASSFALFAMLTSFVGVAMGLFDFFADGLHIRKTVCGRGILALLTFLPPILFALFYPRFLLALHYAGLFGAVLLVMYPALMVWFGRYRLKITAPYLVWGGKYVVIGVLLFGMGIFTLEVLRHTHSLPSAVTEKSLFED